MAYHPPDLAKWSAAIPTVAPPTSIWPMNDEAMPLVDGIGDDDFVTDGSDPTLGGSGDPLGRASVVFVDASRAKLADTSAHDNYSGSMSLWVRGAHTEGGVIAAKYDTSTGTTRGFRLYFAGGVLRFNHFDDLGNTGTILTGFGHDGAWRDLFCVWDWDAGEVRLVVDGAVAGTIPLATAPGSSPCAAELRLGWTAGAGDAAAGELSYAAAFDYALSDAEIADILAAEPPPEAGDGVGPEVTNLTPASGSSISRYEAVEFDVGDADGLGGVLVTCLFEGDSDPLVVYDGTFYGRWVENSTYTPNDESLSDPGHFSILPTGGWRNAVSELKIVAYDSFGSESSLTGSWSLVSVAASAPQPTPSEIDQTWGRDLWFDLSQAGHADLVVTPAGDWKVVGGREALRQAIIRRIVTNPGDWQTLPEYGVGARLFVKARNTKAARDELESRIRGNLLRDDRITSVDQVHVEFTSTGLKIAVVVTPRGQSLRAQPLAASVEIS